ncbi:MAG: hypothetical protein RSB41_01125 [Bacilli bacterium]
MLHLNKSGKSFVFQMVFLMIFVFCILLTTAGLYKLDLLDVNKVNKFLNPNYYSNTNTVNPDYMEDSEIAETPVKTNKKNYDVLENELVLKSEEYVKNIYKNNLGLDTLIITVSNLKSNNYMSDLIDYKGSSCSGYTEVYKDESGNIKYSPYIKCKRYKTKGYLERKDN